MDKIDNRKKFYKGFQDFLKSMLAIENITKLKDFIDRVKEHQYFKDDHSANIESLGNMKEKLIYIFMGLTNGKTARESCDAIIGMLELSGLLTFAKKLREYNTSPGLINVWNSIQDFKIEVSKTAIPITGSNPYKMIRNPRGKFIIIDNIKNDRKKNYNEEFIESNRFEHVFTELFFEVEVKFDLTVIQIKEELKNLKIKISKQHEAFGLMIITHGGDEEVLGINACNGKDTSDKMKISDIVQMFSDLKTIPKLFIFDCCRIKNQMSFEKMISFHEEFKQIIESQENPDNKSSDDEKNEELQKLVSIFKNDWVNIDIHNFIIYSCSEGYESWFWSISAFGQAFSLAIARYACEESLQTIMCRTCKLMDQFKKANAYSAPEFRLQCTKRELYFNAGFCEENKSNKTQKTTKL